jgi:outer membrane protein assembly factor BamB
MSSAVNLIRSNIAKGDAALGRSSTADYYTALNSYLDAAFHIAEERWHIPVHQKIRSLVTADINGDGKDEVLFGTEGHLLFAYESSCINGKDIPSPIWEKPFNTENWITGIAVADINNDGVSEIIVASDKLYILNAAGEQIDQHILSNPISSLQLYSDSYGNNLIVTGDNNGNIHCFNYEFIELWSLPFKKSNGAIIDLAIGDFDGDGKIEVAAASEDKSVYIINDLGEEKDKIDVKHWIVNMADCRMKNSKLRLFIGKFTGDTLVYKHKQTSQAVSLEQSGILDLKAEYIFEDDEYPQFIVGSSDRCIYIFDYFGQPIWIFESGLGQRALSIKKNGNGNLTLFVGTESGDVFCYLINLEKTLVSKIRAAYENVRSTDLLDLKLEPEKLKILRNYIEYNPINQNASLEKAKEASFSDFNSAVIAGMEVWFNNCGFIWKFATKGRVYDLAPYVSSKGRGLLVGSDDGVLYCLNQDGSQEWSFNSRNDMRGNSQGIRGVFSDIEDGKIFIASVDKSLYSLASNGMPKWNFFHDDWLLFASSGCFDKSHGKNVFVGTEDGYVLALDSDGVLIWKISLGKRIRALSFCDDYRGKAYLIAGCDDNKVYIIDSVGNLHNSFSTPHYVLVVQANDIDNDGEIEILTGNEDGHLHVYDFEGNFLWRFETESWIAALDVLKNNDSDETEIAIGSQDNHIYILNKYGALLWQYEANARVRTISADSQLNRIAFGSYDKNAYVLEQANRDSVNSFLQELFNDFVKSPKNSSEETQRINRLLEDESRHKRAFAYMFVRDIETLKKGLNDHSDVVKAVIGCNLVENHLPKNMHENLLIELLVKSSRRVKAIILTKLIQVMNNKQIKKRIASRVLSDVIKTTATVSSKIDMFRYWLAIADSCDDILRLSNDLLPEQGIAVDEFLIDELNRACLLALKKKAIDNGDYTILKIVERLSSSIKQRYPVTAKALESLFL